MTRTISLTGATGFIGRHLLEHLSQQPGVALRALAFGTPENRLPQRDNITWIRGDLGNPAAIRDLCMRSGTLIHLAYPAGWSPQHHLDCTGRLAELVAEQGIRRVVHCSTAVVAGTVPEHRVTEVTPVFPGNEYERTKLMLESEWLGRATGKFDLAIARPTAVFGPGSRNLMSLADALTQGSPLHNYLRTSIFGNRRMNLVCVQNVVSAFKFLALRETDCNGDVFLMSDDDDPLNNFRDVERILKREFGLRNNRFPVLPVPPLVLSVWLRISGRSCTDPQRVYDDLKLRAAGWRKALRLEDGLRTFAAWYQGMRGAS